MPPMGLSTVPSIYQSQQYAYIQYVTFHKWWAVAGGGVLSIWNTDNPKMLTDVYEGLKCWPIAFPERFCFCIWLHRNCCFTPAFVSNRSSFDQHACKHTYSPSTEILAGIVFYECTYLALHVVHRFIFLIESWISQSILALHLVVLRANETGSSNSSFIPDSIIQLLTFLSVTARSIDSYGVRWYNLNKK